MGLIVIWFAVIFGNDVSVFTSVVLFIIFIGYFGIKQMGIFTHTAPSIGDLEEAESEQKELNNKYMNGDRDEYPPSWYDYYVFPIDCIVNNIKDAIDEIYNEEESASEEY